MMSAQTVASVPSTPPNPSNSSSSSGAEDSHSRPKRRGRPGPSSRSVRRTVLSALAVVLALLWVFPVYWMVNSAFLDKVTLQETTPTFLPFGGSLDNFTAIFTADLAVRLPLRVWSIHSLPRSIVNSTSCMSL